MRFAQHLHASRGQEGRTGALKSASMRDDAVREIKSVMKWSTGNHHALREVPGA